MGQIEAGLREAESLVSAGPAWAVPCLMLLFQSLATPPSPSCPHPSIACQLRRMVMELRSLPGDVVAWPTERVEACRSGIAAMREQLRRAAEVPNGTAVARSELVRKSTLASRVHL
jgi:hypothetical protein